MRIIKRLLPGLLGLIAALIVFVVGSVVVDGFSTAGRVAALTNMEAEAGDRTPVRAYVARPSTPGPHPAVIMIHEWWGLREEIIDKADALAAEGYIVIAPDALRGRSTSWVPSALYGVISTPPEQIDGDIETVFQWLVAQPSVRTDRIAVMGFCFGGGASLRYSLGNPKLAATVVFYGQLVTEAERLKALSGPVLGIFGGADSAPSPEQARAFEMALKQAGKSHEVTIYDGQPHAFVGDMAQVRAGGPQGAAWAQLLRFLDASLKQDRASTPILWSDTRIASNSVDLVYVLELALAHAFTQGHRGH